MKIAVTTIAAFVVAACLQGCATDGTNDGASIMAADTYQNPTPSMNYIYRSPPPAVAHILAR